MARRDSTGDDSGIHRRRFLEIGIGAGVVMAACRSKETLPAPEETRQAIAWDEVADIVVIGTGAAGLAAAATAAQASQRVVMLEAADAVGGTTLISGGVFWIPNNHKMRALGIEDPRPEALRYMARIAYPGEYSAERERFGLPENEYALIEAFYDNGAAAIEHFETAGILVSALVPTATPDYFAHLPESSKRGGRAMTTAVNGEHAVGGVHLVSALQGYLEKAQVPIHLGHRVSRVITEPEGRVVGVTAEVAGGATRRFGARKAVIFASGGFANNAEMRARFLRGPIFGSCGVRTNQGTFVGLGASLGAALGNLSNAWWSNVALEAPVPENNPFYRPCVSPAGDSMVVVNRHGRRVMSEYGVYHDRGRVHHQWDPTRHEYPNKVLFMIFDQRVRDRWAGRQLLPVRGADSPHLIEGADIAELTARISERLAHHAELGNHTLDPAFAANLTGTIQRFDGYARSGVDEEFHRGETPFERYWFYDVETDLFPVQTVPESAAGKSNITMHPFDSGSRLYAVMLAAGAMDSCGGPVINARAQVIDWEGTPIPSLYGAGNCISSPAGSGYWGGGGTIGPALAFGYIAGSNAAKEQPHLSL